MWKWMSKYRPNASLTRKLLMVLVLLAATGAAFYLGRTGGASQAAAQQAGSNNVEPPFQAAPPSSADYKNRVVAYIYDNVPITREELGEYLIARFGAERTEFLINRRIVELACQAKGISVTDAEVKAQLDKDLQNLGAHMTEKDFVNQVLKRFNKTLYEWKEDVIRPKLLLDKYCRPDVKVDEKDLQEAFEARYGPKVECRMIVFQNETHALQAWPKVSQSEQEFDVAARNQYIPNFSAQGGRVTPIHKHFGDDKIERTAFSLKPGEVSEVIGLKDKSFIILKCDKHIPPDTTKSFDQERHKLFLEMMDVKVAQRIPEVFNDLRKKANPNNFLADQHPRQEVLERAVRKELTPPQGNGPGVTGQVGK